MSKTTKISFLPKEKITKLIQLKRPWENVPAMNGIKNFHIICWQQAKMYDKKIPMIKKSLYLLRKND